MKTKKRLGVSLLARSVAMGCYMSGQQDHERPVKPPQEQPQNEENETQKE